MGNGADELSDGPPARSGDTHGGCVGGKAIYGSRGDNPCSGKAGGVGKKNQGEYR